MAETSSNIDIANHLNEESSALGHDASDARLELFEAILLALVAVATAWSGYQASMWEGRSARSYAQTSVLRVEADEEITLAGQVHVRDTSIFNAWLSARMAGDSKLMEFLERRFSPDYADAFRAWLATDPFNDPNSPPGPAYMPLYKGGGVEKARETKRLADEAFETGRASREVAERYVRLTVVLATFLFLIAIAQRLRYHTAKTMLLGVAATGLIVVVGFLIFYATDQYGL